MFSPAFRRAARLFAVVLLAWTAVDLLDFGVCVQHHGRIGSFTATEWRAPNEADTPDEGCEDCFCCSHVVDVRTPYHIALAYTVAWVIADHDVSTPPLTPTPLYHPPLA